MQTVHTVTELRDMLRSLRKTGKRMAFVPTMGNLHDGHNRLIKQAHTLADYVVVSIFVNPLQFNDKRDFDTYPVTLEEDSNKLADVKVSILFNPEIDQIYPGGMERSTMIEVPGLSDILCGHFRPGHFGGVATVAAKLFNIVQPEVAVFGEKDYQQLLIIRRMVADLCLPIEIVGVETVREADGLAMSSRNSYLSQEERVRAPVLYRILQEARDRIRGGETDYRMIETDGMDKLSDAGFRVEYFSIRRAEDLENVSQDRHNLIILAAAWLGKARLIDNILINRT